MELLLADPRYGISTSTYFLGSKSELSLQWDPLFVLYLSVLFRKLRVFLYDYLEYLRKKDGL